MRILKLRIEVYSKEMESLIGDTDTVGLCKMALNLAEIACIKDIKPDISISDLPIEKNTSICIYLKSGESFLTQDYTIEEFYNIWQNSYIDLEKFHKW